MFDKEFYPTPQNVIDMMGIDCLNRVVYEPHGGKGDIIKFCINQGASQVIASEKNDDLNKICSNYCHMIGSDFFDIDSTKISHVDMIVMNPPFSNAEEHILHAWEIAPEGCEIISLCNWETIDGRGYYGAKRRELNSIIQNYGNKECLGDCFSNSERKTNVEVGLVRLFKPINSEDFNYDGFYYGEEFEVNQNGLIKYDEIRAIVNSYVGGINKFREFERIASEFNETLKNVGLSNVGKATFEISRNNTTLDKDEFSKELQFKCWDKIFNKMNIGKYVTKGVMDEINKFINLRKSYPFTMRNVYRMLDIIIGTSEQTMNKAICEAIDNFTRHTHENRYGVEGWVTNNGHLLNKKFIIGSILGNSYSNKYFVDYYGIQYNRLKDLVKALCYVTGTNYDTIPELSDIFIYDDLISQNKELLKEKLGDEISNHSQQKLIKYLEELGVKLEFNRRYDSGGLKINHWYDWGFFEIKFYKKGTAHIKFKNLTDWSELNRRYAKIKGMVLPEKI